MPPLTPAEPGAAKPAAAAAKPAAAAAADEGPVDETGVDPKDIELVMAQTNASRARAVKALKKKNNDIVEAIIVRISVLRSFSEWMADALCRSSLSLEIRAEIRKKE